MEKSIFLRIIVVTKCKKKTDSNCHKELGLLNETVQRWVSFQAWCTLVACQCH